MVQIGYNDDIRTAEPWPGQLTAKLMHFRKNVIKTEPVPGNRKEDSTSPAVTSPAIIIKSQSCLYYILSFNEN